MTAVVWRRHVKSGPLAGVPIAGSLGDQMSAMLGQRCKARPIPPPYLIAPNAAHTTSSAYVVPGCPHALRDCFWLSKKCSKSSCSCSRGWCWFSRFRAGRDSSLLRLEDEPKRKAWRLCQVNEAKNTYGTGAFILLNTGPEPVPSEHGLLTTIAYKLGPQAATQYALEGVLLPSWPADLQCTPDTELLGRDLTPFGQSALLRHAACEQSRALLWVYGHTSQHWSLDPSPGCKRLSIETARPGAIAIAGAGISWLRDGLGIIDTADQSEELAATVEDTAGVVFVPAFRWAYYHRRGPRLHCDLLGI